ncbi:MAG: ATP-binding domain-containing protein [Paludibacteraceae bacterium]|nr:ATP-binding domain-containing protein [Paludibacteraceae bacterium]
MAKKDWMVIESELDEDQIRVLMATNDKSLIVSGCAGSGKSVLALIKAQRIQKEKGNNYKVIVFTKALCRYMNSGRESLGLRNDFYYHYEWKKCNRPSADYIIVDEIQDFDRNEIQEFISATNRNFFFFGDTAQSIYEGLKRTLPVEEINYMLTNRAKVFNLYRNYRLPRPVAKVVQYVGVDLEGFDIDTYKSRENAIPRFLKIQGLESQISSIARMIKNGSVSDVGILVQRNEDVRKVHELLNSFGVNHELKYDDKTNWHNNINNLDFSTENPKVMTYHSAKGLQFGTVFLPNVVSQQDDSGRKALYVAMTRTYRNLIIMYSDDLPYPLSKIPQDLYKKTERDQVEDI